MRHSRTPYLLASVVAFAALAGCETVAEEANQVVGTRYTAILSPSGGGTGSAKADISTNDTTNTLCTDLELGAGVAMTAGHILGPGDTVVSTLEVPRDGDSDDCDAVADNVVDAIKANPGAYRVHVAATTGDLWGTLRKAE